MGSAFARSDSLSMEYLTSRRTCYTKLWPLTPRRHAAGQPLPRASQYTVYHDAVYYDTVPYLFCPPSDGTLLDSRSRVLPCSAAAIRAAAAAGVTVVAATGKARPAALAAAAAAGLQGPGLLVWPQGPGVFLQVRVY